MWMTDMLESNRWLGVHICKIICIILYVKYVIQKCNFYILNSYLVLNANQICLKFDVTLYILPVLLFLSILLCTVSSSLSTLTPSSPTLIIVYIWYTLQNVKSYGPGGVVVNTRVSKVACCGFRSILGWIVFHKVLPASSSNNR